MKKPLEVKVPFTNVNDVTAKIISWRVTSGATVKEGDVIAELETTKAAVEVTAPAAGVVEYTRPIGEEAPVGEALCHVLIEVTGAEAAAMDAAATPPAPTAAPQPKPGDASGSVLFSKKAQELMAESGLDPQLFAGMASVKEADVRRKLDELGKSGGKPAPTAPPPVAAAAPAIPGEEGDKVPLERSKLFENRELLAADRAVLKSTLYYCCPAVGFQDACAKRAVPIQRLAVILFETVQLLKKFRHLNAYLDETNAFLYKHVHIGFAVDMGRGLKVLVIRNAEELNFPQLAEQFGELLVKYSTNLLEVKDVTGSTFTVTDLSQDGVFTFAPLINNRQAAILGIGAENTMGFMLSCAFDHRLTGGRQVGEFLKELSNRLVGQNQSLLAEQPPVEVYCSRCLQNVADLRKKGAFLIPSIEPPGRICSICLAGW